MARCQPHNWEIKPWSGDVRCTVCEGEKSYWHPDKTLSELDHECGKTCPKGAKR